MDRLRKHYSHLVGCSFLAGKAVWALSGCLTTRSAHYCMLINEWAWLISRICLLRLEVDLGSVLESKLGQKWTQLNSQLSTVPLPERTVHVMTLVYQDVSQPFEHTHKH